MEAFLRCLEAGANVASIATAAIAVWAFWRFGINWRRKITRLEQHLRAERKNGRVAIAVIELVAELGMSESEIMDAAFESRHIIRLVRPDGVFGSSPTIVLEYQGK